MNPDAIFAIRQALGEWERSQRCVRGHVRIIREDVDQLIEQLETALSLARVLAQGHFATAHPDGAFGLPPNTWDVPDFIQKMARNTLELTSNPATEPEKDEGIRSAADANAWD